MEFHCLRGTLAKRLKIIFIIESSDYVSSMVLDLQRDVLENKKKSSELLRNAYLIARKLNSNEFVNFTNLELNGYKTESILPDYRKLQYTKLEAFNPYYGWVPLQFKQKEIQKMVYNCPAYQSISCFDELLTSNETFFIMDLTKLLFESCRSKCRGVIERTQIKQIIETVKNILLEWSIQLEQDGISVENMHTTEEEKEIAMAKHYTVNNYFNGDVENLQMQQSSPESTQIIEASSAEKIKQLVEEINKNISNIQTDNDSKMIIKAETEKLREEFKKEKPQKNVITRSLGVIKDILTTAASGLIASGIAAEISKLVS